MDPIEQPAPVASEFPPVQASPEAAPGMPETGEALSEGEMRTNLENAMAKLKDKYSQFSDQKFVADNQQNKRRSDALSELFTLLEARGVNPENPEEIRAFLDKLRQSNPEIADQVEQAIKALLGEEEQTEVSTEGTAEVPEDNMNINTNEEVPQNI